MSHTPISVPDLIDQGLGPELHWFPEDVTVTQLASTLIAMANSTGGNVLIGISPRAGRIQGVRDHEGVTDRIFQAALLSDPPLILPVPRTETVEGVSILHITVPIGLPHVYNLEGRYLGRSGSREAPLSARKLRALLVERGVIQFESRIHPSSTLDDLDPEQVAAYQEKLGLPVDQHFQDLLLRRGCLKMDNNQARPTYAALLLFGRHPQQWIPSASMIAARFPGTSFSDEFIKQEIRGTLPEQLRQAEAFVRDHMRLTTRLVGLTRQEIPEYPLEAVRELLVNAVAHRDYSQQGDTIHLHIFADRLEVHSPGRLPGPVTLSNLLESRFSRNAIIAQVLSDLGFVERLGYGLKRVLTAVKQNNLPKPKFEELGGAFRVTLFSKNAQNQRSAVPDLSIYAEHDLNPRQQRALSYLVENNRITNSDYLALCPEVSAETVRRDLVDFVKKGILIKVGDKRATYYILKK